MSARRVGWAGLALFVGLVALQHLTRPALDPAQRFVSEYARGEFGWVMTVAFAGWTASLAATTVATWPRARTVALLVAVAAAGGLLCTLFDSQTVGGELSAGLERTDAGRLHDFGSLLLLAGLFLGALAHAVVTREKATTLATIGLALAFVAFPAVLVIAGQDVPGIGQRGLIALGLLWQALLLHRLARPPSRGRGAEPGPAT